MILSRISVIVEAMQIPTEIFMSLCDIANGKKGTEEGVWGGLKRRKGERSFYPFFHTCTINILLPLRRGLRKKDFPRD